MSTRLREDGVDVGDAVTTPAGPLTIRSLPGPYVSFYGKMRPCSSVRLIVYAPAPTRFYKLHLILGSINMLSGEHCRQVGHPIYRPEARNII